MGGARVLVAESSGRVRQAVAAYLRGDGFQVLEASSGLEALLKLRLRIAELDAGADDYVASRSPCPR